MEERKKQTMSLQNNKCRAILYLSQVRQFSMSLKNNGKNKILNIEDQKSEFTSIRIQMLGRLHAN